MGGMYGRDKDLNWKKFKDITFFAAMGAAGGGKNEVDSRFVSKFATFNVVFPADLTLKHIYSSILSGHLSIFNSDVLEASSTLIEMTLKLFKVNDFYYYLKCVLINDTILKIVIVELPPTPSKFHYIFNLKDLSRIFSGMLLIDHSLFTEPKQLVRVWRNEFTRVICDRLNSEAVISKNNRRLKLVNPFGLHFAGH